MTYVDKIFEWEQFMKKSKLINFTTLDFVSEKELELKLLRWDKIKDKHILNLKTNGLLRLVTTKVWNKEEKSRLGHLFEYEPPETKELTHEQKRAIEEEEKEHV